MKLLSDIKDSKAKARFLHELKSAVKEVVQAKQGKLKLQTAKDFLNKL